VTKSGDELPVGQSRGRVAGDDPCPGGMTVGVEDVMLQSVADAARTEDHQVIGRRDTRRDLRHEPPEMLETLRFAGLLRCHAAMADRRVVADVAGRAMVGLHVRLEPLEPDLPGVPVRDDGLAKIDAEELRCDLPPEYRRLVEIWRDGVQVPFGDYLRRFGMAFAPCVEGEYLRFEKAPTFGEDLERIFEIDLNRLHAQWNGIKCVYRTTR
jgi:hypothetical protein